MDIPSLLQQLGPEELDKQIKNHKSNYTHLVVQDIKSQGLEAFLGEEDAEVPTSLDYLLVLHDCCTLAPDSVKNKFDGLLWQKRLQYLERFDPIAVRYAGKEFLDVLEGMLMAAWKGDAPHMAIVPLRTVLLRLDPLGSTFTSLHLPYLQICLATRLYAEALQILDRPIYNYPADHTHGFEDVYLCSPDIESSVYITYQSGLTSKIHYRHVQEYWLLCGMIYIALGQAKWQDALLAFEMVITSPTQNCATGYMLEAYCKWLLLNLLLHGKLPDMPKSVSPTASRTLQSAAKPYLALASAFAKQSSSSMSSEIQEGLEVWDNDGNLGLVRLLEEYHARHRLLKLQDTYKSYPLNLVDNNRSRAIRMVESLRSTGKLNARIEGSDSDTYIHFESGNKMAAMSEAEVHACLSAQFATNTALANAVKSTDQRIVLSTEFVQAARKARIDAEAAEKRNETASAENFPHAGMTISAGPGGMPGGFNDSVDEDLMES